MILTLIKPPEKRQNAAEYGWTTKSIKLFESAAGGNFQAYNGKIKLNIQRSIRDKNKKHITLEIKFSGGTIDYSFSPIQLRKIEIQTQKSSEFIHFRVVDNRFSEFLVLQTGKPASLIKKSVYLLYLILFLVLLSALLLRFRRQNGRGLINKFTDEIGGALLERRLLLFFLFFILFYLFYQNNWVRLAGDEPNYLLMASSIASDFDLDLRNNYLNHDYENFAFIPFRLPDGLQGSSPIYAVHEPGLAILLSPLFWLYYNGTTSINLVELSKIVMLLFTSLAALNLFLTVKNLQLFKRDENILLLTLGASFLLPFAAYQGQIFPDTVAVGLIAFIFRKLETESETNGSKSRRFSIIFCIIILPWLHIKFALVALLFGLRFLLKNFKKLKDLKKGLLKNIIPGILLITGALAILIYNNLLFGTFLPGSFTGRISGFELKTIRVAGLFFDADFGLINLSPVFITLLAAHIIVFIRHKALSIRLILYSAALFLPHALFSHWWLGFCPAGRPFVSPFLLLTLPIFFYISALGWRNLVYTLPLFILSFLITILFMQRPNLFYHADGNPFENSVGNYLTRIGSFDFSSFFISYPFAQMNYYYPLFIMTLIFASILFIFWSGKSQR